MHLQDSECAILLGKRHELVLCMLQLYQQLRLIFTAKSLTALQEHVF